VFLPAHTIWDWLGGESVFNVTFVTIITSTRRLGWRQSFIYYILYRKQCTICDL